MNTSCSGQDKTKNRRPSDKNIEVLFLQTKPSVFSADLKIVFSQTFCLTLGISFPIARQSLIVSQPQWVSQEIFRSDSHLQFKCINNRYTQDPLSGPIGIAINNPFILLYWSQLKNPLEQKKHFLSHCRASWMCYSWINWTTNFSLKCLKSLRIFEFLQNIFRYIQWIWWKKISNQKESIGWPLV